MKAFVIIISSWLCLVAFVIGSIAFESQLPDHGGGGFALAVGFFMTYVGFFLVLIILRFFVHNLIPYYYSKYKSADK